MVESTYWMLSRMGKSIVTALLLICASCASHHADVLTVRVVLRDYSPHDMHSQIENGPDEWHDGATFEIEHPQNQRGTKLTVFFPSDTDNSPFRPVVGTKYEFTIKGELISPGLNNCIFDGELRGLEKLKDNNEIH